MERIIYNDIMKTGTDRTGIRTADSYIVTEWSGGLTTELAIAPPGSIYADRLFDWRLSSATVETEESIFTPLADYNRIIMSLTGPLRLQHDDGPWHELTAFMPHAFDGAAKTVSMGTVTDFNLMLRKGRCDGFVMPFRMQEGERVNLKSALYETGEDIIYDTLILYAYRGELAYGQTNGNTRTLRESETLMLENNTDVSDGMCNALTNVAAVLAGIRYIV